MTDEFAQMLADIDSILETDFDTQLAVERDPYGATRAIEAALHTLRDQADRIEQLTAERNRLALAICGGEDAPGYANAQTVETLEHVAKQNQLSHGATINSLIAAEAERDRLREDLEELDFLRHEGGPDSVAAMEAELKRLRSVLSDIRNGSVCSVSRHVAASALGEAAA